MNPKYDFVGYASATPQKGKTLLILGTAGDGPVNAPIPITSKASALAIFGDRGSLYRSYTQAFDADSTLTVYLMRVMGEVARCSVRGRMAGGFDDNYLDLKCMNGGAAYNGMQYVMRATETGMLLQLMMPADSLYQSTAYALEEYETIGMLIKAINEDCRAGIHPVYASSLFSDTTSFALTFGGDRSGFFAGGEDGLAFTPDDLFLALDYSYQLLEGFYIDVIVCPDAHFDDVSPLSFYEDASEYGGSVYGTGRAYLQLKDTASGDRTVTFHGRLIEFCKRQMSFGIMTHGILGMNKVNNPAYLESHEMSYVLDVVNSTAFKNRYDLAIFGGGSWTDSGYFVSVVAGEFIYNPDTDDEYYDNWCVTYAALVAGLGPTGTTTNISIPGDIRLRYAFTPDELAELSYIGVVTPRDSVRKGIVVTNGVTASLPNTDTHNIANIRQIQLAIAYLNEALDEFDGQPMKPLLTNKAIDKTVDSVLGELKKQGILIDYNFNIEYDRNRGSAAVSVDLLAKQMVDFMSTSATLSFS